MSGNPRPRVRDRIRDSLPWRKPSASPSAVGAPGPSTNTRYQQFLESALHKLTPSESDIIRRHLAVNTSDITSAVDQAYNAALGQKQVCESKRWRWSFRGKEIVPREEAEKVLRGLDRLKSVGDVAANVDPLHVGLPWAGIRVILELTVAESRQMAALLVGMRLTFSTANRLEAYLNYLQRLPTTPASKSLERTLLETYGHLLRFIATAIATYERGVASRTWRALWETPVIEDFEKECDELEARTGRDASNCDRDMYEQDRVKAKQWKTELELTLQKLDKIAGIRSAVDGLHVKVDLSRLQTASALGATYDSHADEHTAQCLAGTRIDLLDQIATWAVDPTGKNIFWLCGKAGTGKSTISRTVADRLDKQGLLGASFFFKRGEAGRGNASRFFPTITLQLIDVVPGMGRFVAEALDADSMLCQRKLQDQHERLMLEPLLQATQHGQSSIKVIVIDALDECENLQHARAILKLLAHENVVGGTPVRIVVTSRPETPIQTGFKSIDSALHEDIILEEVQAASVEHDIRVYLNHRFQEIRDEHALLQTYDPLPAEWPGNDRIEALVSLAVPLFIFAFTVCRHVSQRNPQGRLENLLRPLRGTSLYGLNEMYLTILDRSLSDLSADEHDRAVNDFRIVVGSIVTVANPLSAASLATILQVPWASIDQTLRPLHSVLHIPASPTSSIRLLHLSFRDFLTDPSFKSSSKFYVDEDETHARLAQQCLQRLSQQGVLSNDVCKVSRPGARRTDFSTDYVAEYLQPDVAYACSFWALHTAQSKQNLHDEDHVHKFLQKHFLHWLEALSWLGQINSAIGFVSELRSRAMGSQISMFLEDAHRFLLRNRQVIDAAPLQTYYSALVFAPVTSILHSHFAHSASRHFSRLPIVPARWGAETQKLEGHDDWVTDIAFSPDGQFIASSSRDRTIRLWKMSTGEELYKLEAHTDIVTAVTFSPDGLMLVSASRDRTIRLWDVLTGEERQKLDGHDDQVASVAVSVDGLLIASASEDRSVRIWDALTGKEKQKLEGHKEWVTSVAFSPDGFYVISASRDETLLLWEVTTGKQTQKFEGHVGWVTAVTYSPNGALLASASYDQSVLLWKVSTGEKFRKLTGHYGRVTAVAFSPNGSLIVSASQDRTVRLWNVSTGEETHKLEGHDVYVTAVAFAPHGSLVASASRDQTVRLWTTSKSRETQKLTGHDDYITAIVVSPDGQLVASASRDQTVRLWKTSIGTEIRKLEHSDTVSAVAFSPDGLLVASASFDGTVQLWDLSTGNAVQKHKVSCKGLCAVAFSPDGLFVASAACHTDTVHLLSVLTGKETQKLEGHTDWICAVAFSPEGSCVASASRDRTVRLWKTSTGTEIQKLEGHSHIVTTVAFSPSGAIVASASSDRTVRLWNVSAGDTIELIDTARVVSQLSFSSNGRSLDTDLGRLRTNLTRWAHPQHAAPECKILLSDKWICLHGQDALWLPHGFRGASSATHGNTLIIGQASGTLSFFEAK